MTTAQAKIQEGGKEMEKAEIEAKFEKANSLRDWPGRYFPALAEAREAKKQWEIEHPEEARQEIIQTLQMKASELKRKASDALFYDADGTIGKVEQQNRHDAFMAEAAIIEAEITKI